MTFSSGIITGAVAMLPVVWIFARLWSKQLREHLADLKMANELIEKLEPLATLGRTRRASYDTDNARRKASRAKKREAGE